MEERRREKWNKRWRKYKVKENEWEKEKKDGKWRRGGGKSGIRRGGNIR